MNDARFEARSADGTAREELHFRCIEMRGFRRADGLYEVEGWVTDRKSSNFTAPGGGMTVKAGDPIHDMGLILTFDDDLIVHDIQTRTTKAPYAECPAGGDALRALKGARIASGWGREVRNRLERSRSCTHLVELLIPLGTTALQTLGAVRTSFGEVADVNGRPVKIDSCYSYRAAGQVVLRRWPEWHRGTVEG
jgi:hypothetical protein